jgi:hypothetical protein
MGKNVLLRNLLFGTILSISILSYIYVNTSLSLSAAIGVNLSQPIERVEENTDKSQKSPSFDVEVVKFLLNVAKQYIPASL